MFDKFLQRLDLKAEKVFLDKNPQTSKSNGVAWFHSSDKNMLIRALRLRFANWGLETFLMGFTYEEWHHEESEIRERIKY